MTPFDAVVRLVAVFSAGWAFYEVVMLFVEKAKAKKGKTS